MVLETDSIKAFFDTKTKEQLLEIAMELYTKAERLLKVTIKDEKTFFKEMRAIRRVGKTSLVNSEATARYKKIIEQGLNYAIFEKKVTLIIKKYAKRVIKTKNYENLDLAFAIFIAFIMMQDELRKNISSEALAWRQEINGVTYISNEEQSNNIEPLRASINENIKKLIK